MQFHQIKPTTTKKRRKRVGRGGKRGTFSGRGVKGQKARSGGTPRPELRDFLKRIPKKRGWKQKPVRAQTRIVSVGAIADTFEKNETVTITALEERGLIDRTKRGEKPRPVKILADGAITIPVTVASDITHSDAAREQIEEVGGEV